MPKIFTAYGALVLLSFAFSSHQGYVYTSLFSKNTHHRSGSNHYHK